MVRLPHFTVWQIFISSSRLAGGSLSEGALCQKPSSCSYITLVINGGSFWTFAHSSLLWQGKGYKTLGPVSRCHLGENLSGLQVPSDWIIMNNEWSFMLHWSINKMGMTGRNSGAAASQSRAGWADPQLVGLPGTASANLGLKQGPPLITDQALLYSLRFSLWVVIKSQGWSSVHLCQQKWTK